MPTILGFETANVAVCISLGALAVGLSSFATYYQNFIRYEPELEVGLQIDGFSERPAIQGSSVFTTLSGIMTLSNLGNKATFVLQFNPFIFSLDDITSDQRKLLDKMPVLENIPELRSIVDASRMMSSSFRLDPDVTKQNIGNIYIKAGDQQIIRWKLPVEFDLSTLSKTAGADFLWGLRLVLLNSKNSPVVKTISGSIIHHNGQKSDGTVDLGTFAFSSYTIPRKAL